MWLPTPKELVDNMLSMAQVNEQDLLYDLGAGDGVIAITAAKKHGARAVGIEYNPKLAAFAQQKVIEAGVQDRVRIVHGDIFQTDFSQATVLTLYLLPEINYQLRPTILKMKPGTRVVSHDFDMVEWEPDAITQTARARALWGAGAGLGGSPLASRSIELSIHRCRSKHPHRQGHRAGQSHARARHIDWSSG